MASTIVRKVDSVGTLIGRQLVERGLVPEGALVVLASISLDLGRIDANYLEDSTTLMPTVSVDWLLTHSLKAAVIVIGAAIIIRAARVVIARLQHRLGARAERARSRVAAACQHARRHPHTAGHGHRVVSRRPDAVARTVD